MKQTFTAAEAAELLSCHVATVQRAIRAGKLKAAKLGQKDFRISRIELAEFWKAQGGGKLFDPKEEVLAMLNLKVIRTDEIDPSFEPTAIERVMISTKMQRVAIILDGSQAAVFDLGEE